MDEPKEYHIFFPVMYWLTYLTSPRRWNFHFWIWLILAIAIFLAGTGVGYSDPLPDVSVFHQAIFSGMLIIFGLIGATDPDKLIVPPGEPFTDIPDNSGSNILGSILAFVAKCVGSGSIIIQGTESESLDRGTTQRIRMACGIPVIIVVAVLLEACDLLFRYVLKLSG